MHNISTCLSLTACTPEYPLKRQDTHTIIRLRVVLSEYIPSQRCLVWSPVGRPSRHLPAPHTAHCHVCGSQATPLTSQTLPPSHSYSSVSELTAKGTQEKTTAVSGNFCIVCLSLYWSWWSIACCGELHVIICAHAVMQEVLVSHTIIASSES